MLRDTANIPTVSYEDITNGGDDASYDTQYRVGLRMERHSLQRSCDAKALTSNLNWHSAFLEDVTKKKSQKRNCQKAHRPLIVLLKSRGMVGGYENLRKFYFGW